MLHFTRFQAELNSNTSNYKLISMDGIKAEFGLHWVMSVGGVIESTPINEYIPSDGVTVLFQLSISVEPDKGRLLKT